jgi:hypothetical protein
MKDVTHRGSDVSFHFDRTWYLSNDAAVPEKLEADLADGQGYRRTGFGESLTASYGEPGVKSVHLRMTFSDGTSLESSFSFEVAALETPDPNDTLSVTATIPYLGELADGEAYVYLAEFHDSLTNPVVVIEGFDIENNMDWDELYLLLNQEELLETVRADGFDAVVLNFTDATDYLQRNSFVITALLEQVRSMIDPAPELTVIGASMGGLATRYGLAYLESQAIDHGVTSFISFDAPHRGANIPLGMQYWLDFFSEQSDDAAFLLSRLDRPAARQMLVYHHTDPPGATGESDPLRLDFLNDLATVGDYPAIPRMVAAANGSGSQSNQGFASGDQVIDYVYESFLVDIIGDVWAVSDGPDQLIFDGVINIFLLPPNALAVTTGGTLPYDSAPGGYRGSMAEMDSTEAPYGDIVALHDNHCFVPTISALDINTTDLFYDIGGDPDILSLTPFDAVYFPLVNQEHILVTAESKEWFLGEVRRSVIAVREESTALGVRLLPGLPNPFTHKTSLRFAFAEPAHVRLAIYDPRGRRVVTLVDGRIGAGSRIVTWDGRDEHGVRLGSGLYFYRLETENIFLSRKLVLLR